MRKGAALAPKTQEHPRISPVKRLQTDDEAQAKAARSRSKLAAGLKTPPDENWLFTGANVPPDYQLNAWLDYEYGRSSRLLRAQVEVASV